MIILEKKKGKLNSCKILTNKMNQQNNKMQSIPMK